VNPYTRQLSSACLHKIPHAYSNTDISSNIKPKTNTIKTTQPGLSRGTSQRHANTRRVGHADELPPISSPAPGGLDAFFSAPRASASGSLRVIVMT